MSEHLVFQLVTEIVPREMRFPLASWADRTCAFHAQLAAGVPCLPVMHACMAT